MTLLPEPLVQEEHRPDSPIAHEEHETHQPEKPKSSDNSSGADDKDNAAPLRRTTTTGHQLGTFYLRTDNNDDDQDWWFASTAIPLLAATIGPMANVCSVAALVTSWRIKLVGPDGQMLAEVDGIPYPDPRWCYNLNVVSLIFGFVGNLFLLLNFTNRIRYIIALPITIIFWYIATAFLIGITIHMNIHDPPHSPTEAYSQGFWYAVISAVLYMVCSMILMGNMLGYFLGHYPQHFNLTDSQRTLILQTMLFFIWLAGGGFMYARIEGWHFVDALYFCDVTILTVGFGDLYPTDDVARGVLFPYSVIGIVMLGLTISSISKFASEIGAKNVIKGHVERQRQRTLTRTVSNPFNTQQPEKTLAPLDACISNPMNGRPLRRLTMNADSFDDVDPMSQPEEPTTADESNFGPKTLRRVATIGVKNVGGSLKRAGNFLMPNQTSKTILLHEEKDRFDAMRRIQNSTDKFKRYASLCGSFSAFGLLWAVGAIVFWQCEKNVQGMTYFEALYFCYVSLLTIGYGDLAPKSTPGRPFFVVWSLLAVPTMTILISHMGDTVISSFNRGTNSLADFTVLPQEGVWREFLERHPWLLLKIKQRLEKRAAERRLSKGFPTGPDPDVEENVLHIPTIEELANEDSSDMHDLAKKLALAIRQVAHDLKVDHDKLYSYEEWVEFTQLIRFTKHPDHYRPTQEEEEEDGLIEWDWIGEDSPMMAEQTEPEFVLDRLTESMGRYIRHQDPEAQAKADERRESLRRESLAIPTNGMDTVDEEGDGTGSFTRARRFRTNSSEISDRRIKFASRRMSSVSSVGSIRRFSSIVGRAGRRSSTPVGDAAVAAAATAPAAPRLPK